ncbi:hypothetical protein [Mucilaginibacter sp.]|uniref:hypothetical protein n=1 Tax=Mucilaginibacter sp. TaxID=1882438 RepID=UPI003265535B
MLFDDTLIKDFWQWFESVSKDLLNYADNKKIIDELDVRTAQLGRFDWEIGPLGEATYFAISPNLNPEKLMLTQKIIDLAPTLSQWIFLPSKPAKHDWKGIFKMKNQWGKEILVDCSSWQYILYQFEDNTFDADVLISGVDGDNDTRNMAVDIAITGYLGEEYFLQTIQNVKVLESFYPQNFGTATSLQHLKKHIESVDRKKQY